MCRLYRELEQREEWIAAARNGVEFLSRHVFDDEGRCYFSLTREGLPSFYQRKPYGAVFVMLGFLEYSRATGDPAFLARATELFGRIERWIEQPSLLGRPVLPGAPQAAQLADVYVRASMALELYHATRDVRWRFHLRRALQDVLPHFDQHSGLLTEMAGPGLRQYPEGRLVCAGSIFEVAWILFRVLELEADARLRDKLLAAVEAALEFGWDREHDGFFYFQDLESKPTLQLEASLKLWWVHAEAICCLAHCFALTDDQKWCEWLERVDAYVFRRFADDAHGEWFGYLDRRGEPALTLKGNNYKGCFHIPRALLLSAQTIERAGLR